jgi:uncharacterized protein
MTIALTLARTRHRFTDKSAICTGCGLGVDGVDLRHWPRLAILGLAAVIALTLPTADVEAFDAQDLYTAQVPINPRDPGAREAAYDAALAQILTRITGSRDALGPEQIEEWFPDPARYVLQYRPGEDDTLWVTLDGAAIETVLRRHRQTVWGSNRPLTLVWLAVDWGQGEREIVAADDPERTAAEARSIDRDRLLRERILEVAAERGVPVAFPILDAEELQTVQFSDIWGGFNESLLRASQRYGATSVLVGRVRPDVAERNRWSYFFADERREWTGQPEEVMNLLADTLADRFAVAGGAQVETIDLIVSGIDSVAAYGAVQRYIEELDMVERLSIDSVSGDTIRYRLSAHGGTQRLRRALDLNRRLEPAGVFAGGMATAAGELRYRWRP